MWIISIYSMSQCHQQPTGSLLCGFYVAYHMNTIMGSMMENEPFQPVCKRPLFLFIVYFSYFNFSDHSFLLPCSLGISQPQHYRRISYQGSAGHFQSFWWNVWLNRMVHSTIQIDDAGDLVNVKLYMQCSYLETLSVYILLLS